uniref:SFRICE_021778 n=1 Tax=Spodoptera frugiperda TaxID=7108 RepID=A0A2H1VCJ9_SPOFR
MLSAYSRNRLAMDSTSFKPCLGLIFISSIPRHSPRRVYSSNSCIPCSALAMVIDQQLIPD